MRERERERETGGGRDRVGKGSRWREWENETRECRRGREAG